MADLPFYPTQRYSDKKLKPEKMNSDTVTALAKAAKQALDTGLLPKDLVDYMLPNLMTENRQDDYGVNRVELPNNTTTKKILETLGISNEFFQGAMGDIKNKYRVTAIPRRDEFDPQSELTNLVPVSGLETNAKLVVAALTEKLATAKRLNGESVTADKVIQLWNGTGPGSENHIRKVKEADQMLRTDPTNKALKDLWDGIVGALPSKPIEVMGLDDTSAVLNTLVSDYDSNK